MFLSKCVLRFRSVFKKDNSDGNREDGIGGGYMSNGI